MGEKGQATTGSHFPSHSDWLKGGHSSEPSGVRHSACPVANPPVKPPLKEKLLENEVNPEDIGLETGVQTLVTSGNTLSQLCLSLLYTQTSALAFLL